MNTGGLAGGQVRNGPATVRPYLLGGLAALSVGAAAIHFAVVFEHFAEYTLYGVFFLVISWAQLIWPTVLLWRPSRLWLWLGIAGNAVVIAVYVASRTAGLPFGPDLRKAAALVAVPVAVIAATTAVMTPGWAGPEGPAGMASGSVSTMSAQSSSGAADPGMGDMGTTDGQPDMKMYGTTAPPTAAQVVASARLIAQTDTSLKRYENVQTAFAAGYTYVLKTNGEEHLLYDGPDPSYQGLNPQHPSSLVYATPLSAPC